MTSFTDTSEKRYGIATYLVSRNGQNQTYCAFILGMARVTPLKPVTIPRLELTAAVVVARMDRTMRAEFGHELDGLSLLDRQHISSAVP